MHKLSIADWSRGVQGIGCDEPMVNVSGELTGVLVDAMLGEEGNVFMKLGLKQLKSKHSKGINHARAIVLALRGRV